MKNLIIALLLILLLIPSISAKGETKTISFDSSERKLVTVGEKDKIDFNLVNGKHTIIIDKLFEDRVDLDVFRYINREPENRPNVGYITLQPLKTTAKLDLNMDKYNDLAMQVLNIDKEKNKVSLIFEKTHECIFSNPKDCEKKGEENSLISSIFEKISVTGIVISLAIIIIGSLIFLVSKKTKS